MFSHLIALSGLPQSAPLLYVKDLTLPNSPNRLFHAKGDLCRGDAARWIGTDAFNLDYSPREDLPGIANDGAQLWFWNRKIRQNHTGVWTGMQTPFSAGGSDDRQDHQAQDNAHADLPFWRPAL